MQIRLATYYATVKTEFHSNSWNVWETLAYLYESTACSIYDFNFKSVWFYYFHVLLCKKIIVLMNIHEYANELI